MVVVLALLPTFFIARYGNESFEAFTSDERALVAELYRVAPEDSALVSFNSLLPWRQTRIEDYRFTSVFEDSIPAEPVPVLEEALTPRDNVPAFLVVSRAQARFAEMMQGQTPDWVESVTAQLLATGRYKVIHESTEGRIIVPIGQL